MATTVRTNVEDGVAVLTLDGGDDLNLFSGATAAELGSALAACAADDDPGGDRACRQGVPEKRGCWSSSKGR